MRPFKLRVIPNVSPCLATARPELEFWQFVAVRVKLYCFSLVDSFLRLCAQPPISPDPWLELEKLVAPNAGTLGHLSVLIRPARVQQCDCS